MILVHRINAVTYCILGDENIPPQLEGLFSSWDYLIELVESLGYKYSAALSWQWGGVVYERQ